MLAVVDAVGFGQFGSFHSGITPAALGSLHCEMEGGPTLRHRRARLEAGQGVQWRFNVSPTLNPRLAVLPRELCATATFQMQTPFSVAGRRSPREARRYV